MARLERIGAVRRAERLRDWFERIVILYGNSVLTFDLEAARHAGQLTDGARAIGQHPGFADIAIAAIAKSRELVVVTANRRHFEPLGVEIFNPLELA